MSEKHPVEIPKAFLLTLAVHGNMGDGELPDLMQIWAQRECERLGLSDELKALQDKRHAELRQRMKNVIGDDALDDLEDKIAKAATVMKRVIR